MLERLTRTTVAEVVVVEGAHELSPVAAVTPDARRDPLCVESTQRGSRLSAQPARIRVVHCEDWAVGPGASLRCGLAALPPEATHALVVLADGPTLDPRSVERLLAHRGDADVVAASYDGTRSHPVVLARAAWGRVPDSGGRALEATLVDCSDLEPPGDVDVPATAPS